MRRLVLAVLTAVLASLMPAAVAAAPPATAPTSTAPTSTTPTSTTLTITAQGGYADTTQPVGVTLTDAAGAPVAGATVAVERSVDGVWQPLATLVTDAAGQTGAAMTLSRTPADNSVRATYAGDATYAGSTGGPVTAALVRRASSLRLGAPDTVVDEQSVTLELLWRAGNGDGVRGRVAIQRRTRKGTWRTMTRVTTGEDGRGRHTFTPRKDIVLRALAPTLAWVEGSRTRRTRINNVPPAPRVRLPRRAPRPRVRLRPQPRATAAGVDVRVTRIPRSVWRSMTGRSWHRGCPVGRAGLRLVRANYYDYSGYRRRGELVVAAGATGQFAGALRGLYAAKIPMRSMYRVDRFGWSRRVRGADDYRSMAAGNTSAFNCRDVVGRPGVRSPHSYGRSFDINPWENPYRASHGWVPNSWWVGRSHRRVAWRSRDHQVVRIMASNGFSWTYGTGDAHHFDARAGNGRVVGRLTAPEGVPVGR